MQSIPVLLCVFFDDACALVLVRMSVARNVVPSALARAKYFFDCEENSSVVVRVPHTSDSMFFSIDASSPEQMDALGTSATSKSVKVGRGGHTLALSGPRCAVVGSETGSCPASPERHSHETHRHINLNTPSPPITRTTMFCHLPLQTEPLSPYLPLVWVSPMELISRMVFPSLLLVTSFLNVV